MGSGYLLKIFLTVCTPRSVSMLVYRLSISMVNRNVLDGTAMGPMISRKVGVLYIAGVKFRKG